MVSIVNNQSSRLNVNQQGAEVGVFVSMVSLWLGVGLTQGFLK
jgi:hypothetical protein